MNTLEARRRLLGRNVYKRTTEGNPAIAQGSLARMYPGITMHGWTEQKGTTGAQLFDASRIPTKTQGGATITNNGDGSFTVSGEGEVYERYSNSIRMNAGEYPVLKEGRISLACNRTVPYFFFQLQDENREIILNINSLNDKQNTAEITQDILQRVNSVVAGFFGNAGESIESGIVNPMVYQTGDGTYESYTGNKPSPSPEYPQPITSAGKYNEDTQKWEYEITIANAQTDATKNQTVTLTADRPLTKWDKLEKRGGQWGWVYKSSEIVLDGSEDERWSEYAENDGYYTAISASVYNDFSVEGYAFSDKFLFVNTFSYEHPSIISPSKYYYFLNVKRYGETLSDWRTYLQTNPVTILYETELETFVTLSESEQELMNALHTYRPTTVLSNDANCNMILTYKTKKSMGGGVTLTD